MKKLRIEVMEILESMAEMNENTIEQEIENVIQYGCSSGYVSALIYYSDTEEFFNRHKEAINKLAHELSNDLFGNPYEIYKKLNFECSKNTMAWFGFEEVVIRIAEEYGIEY